MKSLSMVIPTYTVTDDLERLTLRAMRSYRYGVEEIIVTEDGGRFSSQIMALADIYIYSHGNIGFTKNVNRGWSMAHGDFVAIVNSDTYLTEGNLQDLCIEGKVTSPEITNQSIPFLAGPFWCSPKEVTKERGMLMEAMKNYCSDSEYDQRVRDIFQKVSTVKIFHSISQTVKPTGIIEKSGEDQAIYRQLKEKGLVK